MTMIHYLRRVISKDNDVPVVVNTDNVTYFEETVFADADCTRIYFVGGAEIVVQESIRELLDLIRNSLE